MDDNNWRYEDEEGVNSYNNQTRSYCFSKKPPRGGSSNWQHSVPSWEKKFCAAVGSVPWKKLVETKKVMHLYDNIIKWNDSAGKEAFEIAKNHFYANVYNLPCDNWSPDPDIYIDKINWDSEVDPNLILDLESDPVVNDSSCKDEQVVIFGSNFPPSYQSFSPYGWGDSDDDKKKDPNTSPEYNNHQWETEGNERGGVDTNNNWRGWSKNDETDKGYQGCGDSRNDYWGWNMYDNNNYFYGDVNNYTREPSGRYVSRYKTSRFRKDENQGSRSRRNNGDGRKSSYSCAPANPSSHGGATGHRWSVKKPVS